MLARQRTNRPAARGFSLVELLVVISIIAVLTAVVAFSVRGVSNKSNRAACQADVASVQAATDAFWVANNAWPANVAALVSGNLLRSAPSSSVYTVSVSSTTGAVTSSPACTTL